MIKEVYHGKKKKYEYCDAVYDSQEEIYFRLWLDELFDAGYIKEYAYQPWKIVLLNHVSFEYLSPRGLHRENKLFPRRAYTPDFYIKWENTIFSDLVLGSAKYENQIKHNGTNESWIEVKAQYINSRERELVNLKRAMVYDQYRVYISIVRIGSKKKSLFDRTFTPQKYLLTNTGKRRKIHFEPKRLPACLDIVP